jgi:hypothetical protein
VRRSIHWTCRCCWPNWWTSRCCSRYRSSSSSTVRGTRCWRRSASTRTPGCPRRTATWRCSAIVRSPGVRSTSRGWKAPGRARTGTAGTARRTRTRRPSRWRWSGPRSLASGTRGRRSCSGSGSRGSTRRVWRRRGSGGPANARITSRTKRSAGCCWPSPAGCRT